MSKIGQYVQWYTERYGEEPDNSFPNLSLYEQERKEFLEYLKSVRENNVEDTNEDKR